MFRVSTSMMNGTSAGVGSVESDCPAMRDRTFSLPIVTHAIMHGLALVRTVGTPTVTHFKFAKRSA